MRLSILGLLLVASLLTLSCVSSSVAPEATAAFTCSTRAAKRAWRQAKGEPDKLERVG